VNTHTPGPWSTESLLIFGAMKKVAPGYSFGDRVADVFGDNPDAEANARLIAAAPDLLDALDSLVEELRGMETQGDIDEYDEQGYDLASCVRGARAAIDKARGDA